MITKFNEWVAKNLTIIFGSMWTTYAFFLYGLLPIIKPQYMDKLLYWSNTIQLWSLPLLMVGTNILGRDSERRMQEMYNMITTQFEDIKHIREEQDQELAIEEQELIALRGDNDCTKEACPDRTRH